MKINVTRDNITSIELSKVHTGEYNITEFEFSFSEEYNNLTKKAIFKTNKDLIEMAITNNKCNLPSEIGMSEEHQFELRVYAYDIDNEELVLRYSPSPITLPIYKGSYIPGASGSQEITPTEFEQYTNALNEGLEEVANVDIDAEQTETGASVTITNRNGIEKTVTILNGEKGEKGDTGAKGEDGYTPIKGVDYFTEEDIASLNIPTKTSDLNNDSGFINNSVNNLTNYYDKTNTYNKTEIDGKISSVYKYKGSVATYGDLPSTDLTIGDVYNVETDGSNYAWNGTTWDKLGGDVDLSNYYNKTQTDELLSGKVNTSTLNDYYTKTRTDELLGAKQNTIDSSHKLNADLIDDSTSTNKFVTSTDISNWNGKVGTTDYATSSNGGVLKSGSNDFNVNENGIPFLSTRQYSSYTSAGTYLFISKGTLENVITGKGLVSNTDYATNNTGGVIKLGEYGSYLIDNHLATFSLDYSTYQTVRNQYFVSKGTLENVLTARIGAIDDVLDAINGEVI